MKRNEKRYAVQISAYVYADNDEQAKAIANKYCDVINQLDDAKATADVLAEVSFGSLTTRKIQL